MARIVTHKQLAEEKKQKEKVKKQRKKKEEKEKEKRGYHIYSWNIFNNLADKPIHVIAWAVLTFYIPLIYILGLSFVTLLAERKTKYYRLVISTVIITVIVGGIIIALSTILTAEEINADPEEACALHCYEEANAEYYSLHVPDLFPEKFICRCFDTEGEEISEVAFELKQEVS